MRTFFIVITLAEWDVIALALSNQYNSFLVFAFFATYITVTAFTMVSLITGIISEALISAQLKDEIYRMQALEDEKRDSRERICLLLEELDVDGSGTLSY